MSKPQPKNKRCPYEGADCGMIPIAQYDDHIKLHATQLDLLTGTERGAPPEKPRRRSKKAERLA